MIEMIPSKDSLHYRFFFYHKNRAPWFMQALESCSVEYNDVIGKLQTNCSFKGIRAPAVALDTISSVLMDQIKQKATESSLPVNSKYWNMKIKYDDSNGVYIDSVRYFGNRCTSTYLSLKVQEITVAYTDTSKAFSRVVNDISSFGVVGSYYSPDMLRQIETVPNVYGLSNQQNVAVGVDYNFTQGVYAHRNSEAKILTYVVDTSLRIVFFTNYGNYDYGFEFVFMKDGRVRMNVHATGQVIGSSSRQRDSLMPSDQYGTFSQNGQYAPMHEHRFTTEISILGPEGLKVKHLSVKDVVLSRENPSGRALVLSADPIENEPNTLLTPTEHDQISIGTDNNPNLLRIAEISKSSIGTGMRAYGRSSIQVNSEEERVILSISDHMLHVVAPFDFVINRKSTSTLLIDFGGCLSDRDIYQMIQVHEER